MEKYIQVKIKSRRGLKFVLESLNQHLNQMKDGNVITKYEIVDIGDKQVKSDAGR